MSRPKRNAAIIANLRNKDISAYFAISDRSLFASNKKQKDTSIQESIILDQTEMIVQDLLSQMVNSIVDSYEILDAAKVLRMLPKHTM